MPYKSGVEWSVSPFVAPSLRPWPRSPPSNLNRFLVSCFTTAPPHREPPGHKAETQGARTELQQHSASGQQKGFAGVAPNQGKPVRSHGARSGRRRRHEDRLCPMLRFRKRWNTKPEQRYELVCDGALKAAARAGEKGCLFLKMYRESICSTFFFYRGRASVLSQGVAARPCSFQPCRPTHLALGFCSFIASPSPTSRGTAGSKASTRAGSVCCLSTYAIPELAVAALRCAWPCLSLYSQPNKTGF